MIQAGGAGMAGAGTQLAGQVGGMMGGLGGVMNTQVSRFQNNTTGPGRADQHERPVAVLRPPRHHP
ncbi:hypothetical protein ASG60_21240 [Methylobacterium sp. Leaf469]|uniref:hypothetical protein n=1 Tax=Methylobacterium sp. Leaf469 TaxID=1736387 RepID=UPI0006FFAC8B|nr:hypothetical protein [Methylobacterium sp. Leaf469]KQT92672.1 hypothetical protein ASG60_21240 [Methylobacterium sp. Leaf469]